MFAISLPNIRKAVVFLAIYLGIGTVCFYAVKSQIKGVDGIIDSVYFCMVTITTIGYGDFVPSSVLSKLLACAFAFTAMVLFLLLILTNAVVYLFNKPEILIVKALHAYEIADLNGIISEIDTSKVRYKCIRMLIILLLLILVIQVTVDKTDVVDAFYCLCATITTLGCGDMSFRKSGGQIFYVYWSLVSCFSLALLILSVAELSIERILRSLVKWVLAYKIRHEDLETYVADA